MEFLTACFLVLVTTSWNVAARSQMVKCEEDHECGENRFCYITGLCAICTDCSAYYRKPHEWKSCAKSPNECGECFDGYAADTLAEGDVRHFCVPLKSSKNSAAKSDVHDASSWYYAVLVVGIPSVILLVMLLLWCKFGVSRDARRQMLKSEQPDVELVYSRPPPYFNNGESPLLRRETGGLQSQSDPPWKPDHMACTDTRYHNKENDIKLWVVGRTTDGVQQAVPFDYQPEDLKECHGQPRTRSTCRPDEPIEKYDKDDDNEDGLSITNEHGTNGYGQCDSGLRDNLENKEQKDNDSVDVGKRNSSSEKEGSTTSYCGCNNKVNVSAYSLCSESSGVSSYQGSKEHLKSSSEKNILKIVPLTSTFDSGFISESSNRLEKMHEDSFSRCSSEIPDSFSRSSPEITNEFQFTDKKTININVFNKIVCH